VYCRDSCLAALFVSVGAKKQTAKIKNGFSNIETTYEEMN
jgi:hypothetical protein